MTNIELDWLDPKKLDSDPENPRRITQEQLSDLKESINQYGFIQPIIYNKKTKQVVGGHQRVKAAIIQGIKLVPVIQVNWSKKKQKSANLALNKISGEWDYGKLKEYIESIDLEVKEPDDLDSYITGFNEEDLKEIDLEIDKTLEAEEDEFDTEKAIGAIKTPKTKLGDLFLIDGKHRLLCGDSTKKEDVERLLNDTKPVLMVTDPPYGVNYDAHWRDELTGGFGKYEAKGHKLKNDDQVDWSNAYKLFPGSIVYIWHAGKYAADISFQLISLGFEIISQIIWVKQHFALSRGDYHWKHEPCWYAIKKGEKHNWQGARDQSTVWEINSLNPAGRKEEKVDHTTQKPLECMSRPIRNNTELKQIVYDPFLGSGTTLIASEQLNRICYGIEIDPIYCDVIIERYKKLKPDAEIKKI